MTRRDKAALQERFDCEAADVEVAPRFNIAPSQQVLTVAGYRPRKLGPMVWGLVPHWAKGQPEHGGLINARAETAGNKPAFRDAFRSRRCLLPADGFFEWQKTDTGKQPWYLQVDDGALFAMAGLWSWWSPPGRDPVGTCTILTTQPNEIAAKIHDRMPVILSREAEEVWLDPSSDPSALTSLLVPFPADRMSARPVSKAVNRPAVDGPECVAPPEGQLSLFGEPDG